MKEVDHMKQIRMTGVVGLLIAAFIWVYDPASAESAKVKYTTGQLVLAKFKKAWFPAVIKEAGKKYQIVRLDNNKTVSRKGKALRPFDWPKGIRISCKFPGKKKRKEATAIRAIPEKDTMVVRKKKEKHEVRLTTCRDERDPATIPKTAAPVMWTGQGKFSGGSGGKEKPPKTASDSESDYTTGFARGICSVGGISVQTTIDGIRVNVGEFNSRGAKGSVARAHFGAYDFSTGKLVGPKAALDWNVNHDDSVVNDVYFQLPANQIKGKVVFQLQVFGKEPGGKFKAMNAIPIGEATITDGKLGDFFFYLAARLTGNDYVWDDYMSNGMGSSIVYKNQYEFDFDGRSGKLEFLARHQSQFPNKYDHRYYAGYVDFNGDGTMTLRATKKYENGQVTPKIGIFWKGTMKIYSNAIKILSPNFEGWFMSSPKGKWAQFDLEK